jgi:hypothetical protein
VWHWEKVASHSQPGHMEEARRGGDREAGHAGASCRFVASGLA